MCLQVCKIMDTPRRISAIVSSMEIQVFLAVCHGFCIIRMCLLKITWIQARLTYRTPRHSRATKKKNVKFRRGAAWSFVPVFCAVYINLSVPAKHVTTVRQKGNKPQMWPFYTTLRAATNEAFLKLREDQLKILPCYMMWKTTMDMTFLHCVKSN